MRTPGLYALISILLIATYALATLPEQSQFDLILPLTVIAFGAYFLFLAIESTSINGIHIIIAAIIVRIALVPSFPQLSDDIYRFVWDGRLWAAGIHPFEHTPRELSEINPKWAGILLEQMNSVDYKTIYPPVSQLGFYISSLLPTDSLITETYILKTILLISEIGTLLILFKLLKGNGQRNKWFSLYALNPLVITEIMGNLHQEGLMIFFFVLFIYFFEQDRLDYAGLCMGLTIASKLLPLLFCPLVFFTLKGRQRWLFTGMVVITCVLTFGVLMIGLDHPLEIFSSLELYLRKFEFNASWFYAWRALGYGIYGFNTIHIIGPLNVVILILFISMQSLTYLGREQKQIALFFPIYLVFLLLSATVHPWYLILLLFLSVFIEIYSVAIWTSMIMLTYINYSYPSYHENLWIVVIEYVVFLSAFYLERHKVVKKIFVHAKP